MIMESNEPQDVPSESASRRLRRADSVVPVCLQRPGTQSGDGVPGPRPAGSRPRKRWGSNSSPKAGKSQCPSSKAVRQRRFSVTQRKVTLFILCRFSTG